MRHSRADLIVRSSLVHNSGATTPKAVSPLVVNLDPSIKSDYFILSSFICTSFCPYVGAKTFFCPFSAILYWAVTQFLYVNRSYWTGQSLKMRSKSIFVNISRFTSTLETPLMVLHVHYDNCGPSNRSNSAHLIEVKRGQVLAADGLLLGVAALLQSSVSGQEEAHPGAGGGRGVLTCEEEADQHPRDLVIAQGFPVSEGENHISDGDFKNTFTFQFSTKVIVDIVWFHSCSL